MEVILKKTGNRQPVKPDPRFAGLSDLELRDLLKDLLKVERLRADRLAGAVTRELTRRARESGSSTLNDPTTGPLRRREPPHGHHKGGPPPATGVREPRRPRPGIGTGSAQIPRDD